METTGSLAPVMPLGPGVRYRVKTTKSGKKVRLAFRGKGKVVEAKNLATGKTATMGKGGKVTHSVGRKYDVKRETIKRV